MSPHVVGSCEHLRNATVGTLVLFSWGYCSMTHYVLTIPSAQATVTHRPRMQAMLLYLKLQINKNSNFKNECISLCHKPNKYVLWESEIHSEDGLHNLVSLGRTFKVNINSTATYRTRLGADCHRKCCSHLFTNVPQCRALLHYITASIFTRWSRED